MTYMRPAPGLREQPGKRDLQLTFSHTRDNRWTGVSLALVLTGSTHACVQPQAMSIVDQLPPLLQSISDGTREFAPTPDDTREVGRSCLSAPLSWRCL